MRFGKLFFVSLVVAAAVAAMLVAGCSSNSTSTSSVTDDTGSAAVQTEFTTSADSIVSQLAANLSTFQSLQGQDTSIAIAYSPINPDSTANLGGWHIVYASQLVAGYSVYLVDSLQFKNNGHVQDKAIGADQMHLIRHWGVNNPDTTSDYRNIDVASAFLFNSLGTGTTYVTGGRTSEVHTKEVTMNGIVKRTFQVQMNVGNLAIQRGTNGWGTACPQSGTIDGTVTQTVDRGSVPVTTNWQFNVTVDNGVLDGTISAGSWSASYAVTVCQ